jgi:hypothetical protein
MSGDWREAKERLVKLPDDEPRTFKHYLHLLYTNDMAVIPDPLPKDYTGDEKKMVLAKLYVLAEKLQDCGTKDAVVKAIFYSAHLKRPDGITYVTGGLPVIRIMYAGTTSGYRMRKLLVDLHTYRGTSRWLTQYSKDFPPEFLSELAIHLLDKRYIIADAIKTGGISAYMEKKDNSATRTQSKLDTPTHKRHSTERHHRSSQIYALPLRSPWHLKYGVC